MTSLRSVVLLEYLTDRLRRSEMENVLLRKAIQDKDELLELAALELGAYRGETVQAES